MPPPPTAVPAPAPAVVEELPAVVEEAPADLEAVVRRLQQLEAANEQLRREVEQTRALRSSYDELSRKYDDLSERIGAPPAVAPTAPPLTEERQAPPSGGGARREEAPAEPKPPYRIDFGNAYYDYRQGRDGIRFEDPDGEFLFRVRTEIQPEHRLYQQGNQVPVHSGFYLPRARVYFDGHFTKPIEYNFSFNRGYSNFNLLNGYLNFNYFDDRFQLRVGRFKTPYTYEFYKINNWRLLVPERSIFNVNFALNRQVGLMGWGQLFDNRLEYAVGIFDGPRNSFEDYNTSKDVVAFLNFIPFINSDGPLKNLNVGGSVDFGNQNNPIQPAVLRTSTNASSQGLSPQSAPNDAVVPFLAFNNGVVERGDRALWSLHASYYYRSLTLMGSWDSGFNGFALPNKPHVNLPVSGYYVQAGYLLTGEEITERVMVKPDRNFDLRPGKFGLGAIEPYARYTTLNIGNQVFTQGLANPALWTNSVGMVDLGVNWYLNKFTRITFDWEHAEFGSPVLYNNAGPFPLRQINSDMFWFRFYFYF